MKTHLIVSLLAATCFGSFALAEPAPKLAHKITVTPKTIKVFQNSDRIDLEEITGTAPDFRVGGTYRAKGVCHQSTLSNAVLYLGNTSDGQGAITPAPDSTNSLPVTPGDTPFDFTFTLHHPGRLHVSIYDLDNHNPRDNVYAGLVLGPVIAAGSEGSSAKGNAAILAYLGQPVPAPAGLDERFSAKSLLAAFTELCKTSGYTIKKLAVDDSEFPFLIYGRVAGKKDIDGFSKELGPMKPYVYGGSVNGSIGTGDETYFSLNMTPSDRFPADAAQTCSRRLMIRMQMLAAEVSRE